MPDSLLQTVGRGYSDLCAAMCAVAVGAEELQIWKEVDGIFTADPRKVPSARLLSTVTDEEATELTYYGSEVSKSITNRKLSGLTNFTVGHPPADNGSNPRCLHTITSEKCLQAIRPWYHYLPINNQSHPY